MLAHFWLIATMDTYGLKI